MTNIQERKAQIESLKALGKPVIEVLPIESNMYSIAVYGIPVCNVPLERLEETSEIIENTLVAAGVIAVE